MNPRSTVEYIRNITSMVRQIDATAHSSSVDACLISSIHLLMAIVAKPSTTLIPTTPIFSQIQSTF